MLGVYRTLARSTRDRPSADTGRVRESEGAGQLSLEQDEGGSKVGLRLTGRLTMRRGGVGPKADRSNRQSQVLEAAARAGCLGVAIGVACKQPGP